MAKQRLDEQRHRHYVKAIRLAATLIDGPKTSEEISDRSYGYLRIVGFFKKTEHRAHNQSPSVRRRLEELSEGGWVIRDGERYALTPLGHEEVSKRLSQLGETGALLHKLLLPKTVSEISLGAHLGLSALKLPVGLLSGSVGLLNDSLDTLLDGLSSLLVYFGIRINKERAINVALVSLMMAIGGLTLYEAGRRLFVPIVLKVDWYAFGAAVFSAVISLILHIYQRFVGLRSGTMALVTQSVDSRNHIIVAAGVAVGVVASLFRFPLLDTLVGLGVALLILKSAVELAIVTIRSIGKEQVDLSHFKFGIALRYDKFRQAQLRDWMLFLVEKHGIATRAELVTRARQAIDFNSVPALRAMGLSQQQLQAWGIVEQSLAELFERGWLTREGRLSVTDLGRKHLGKWM